MTGRTPLRFSVIVPLGYGRGEVEACLRAWTREQTFPRDRYEVLAVGGSEPLPSGTGAGIRSLIASPDRLVVHDEPHDVALLARGAREAAGELFFFTESHVLPAPETLERADAAVRADPGVAGLSGRSIRLTHNRLSEVEADMYEADIRHGIDHPWRKLLDQCYVARREPYFEAGGFRSEFGHFAEHLLAARLHRLGHRIGHAPEVVVRHRYSGGTGELIEFAEDFARGEMRFHAEAGDDTCLSLFDEIPQWFGRHRWRADLAGAVWGLAAREWWRTPGARDRKRTAAWLRFLAATASRAAFGVRPATSRARLALWLARATLSWRTGLPFTGKESQRAAFVRFNTAAVERSRFASVARWLADGPPRPDPLADPRRASPWEAPRAHAFTSLGFHALEHWHGRPFRWSEPVAMLEVPLAAGEHELSIEWIPVRPVETLAVHVDGHALPVTLGADRGVVRVRQPAPGWARLAWACPPWPAPGDVRFLGLPVHRVAWDS